MDLSLSGKVALVVGGAGDIGRAIVQAFVGEGARTVVADRDVEAASAVAGECGSLAVASYIDVRDEESVQKTVCFVETLLGGLDILVNVVGVLCRKSLMDTTREDFEESLSTNVLGAFLAIREAARVMKKRGEGVIINVSSLNGKLAIENRVAYGASKAALNMLTMSAALELAPHIRVNAVAPGVVDSRMARVRLDTPERLRAFTEAIPLQRLATPRDVANCVLFLASPLASYITGEIVHVDGGVTSRQSLPRLSPPATGTSRV